MVSVIYQHPNGCQTAREFKVSNPSASMTTHLRRALEADLQSLFDLDQVCFPEGIAYSRAEMRSLLVSPRSVPVIAEEDGVLAGFAIAQDARIRRSIGGHIVTIDVAPGFRRRGIGQLLMNHIETQMQRSGAEWLRLEVAVDNVAALSFYAGLGFEPIVQIRGYYRGDLDALVLQKPIPKVAPPL